VSSVNITYGTHNASHKHKLATSSTKDELVQQDLQWFRLVPRLLLSPFFCRWGAWIRGYTG